MKIQSLKNTAKNIRRSIVTMTGTSPAPHAGSALSSVDILTILYFEFLKINPRKPQWQNRDRFILSKGHGAAALYATLSERGFFSKKLLESFARQGSNLVCHPSSFKVSGVEAITGSLGHGLSIGIGMALAAKQEKKNYRVYVLLSDGECDEGSVWEGILFSGHHKLDNLVIIIDYNKIQSFGMVKDVLDLEPFAKKFDSFRWQVQEVDGHNFSELRLALKTALKTKGKPSCIIAHTVKGKGVSFMENKLESHYKPPTGDLLKQALYELR